MSYGTYSHHYIFEYVYIRDEFGLFSEPDDFKDFVERHILMAMFTNLLSAWVVWVNEHYLKCRSN